MGDGNGYSILEANGEQPRPLYRALPEPMPFPMMALGGLRPAAEAIHEMTKAPMAVCAQSVLAAMALAAQPHADVKLPSGTRPLSCYFVTIAESGERKSSVDRIALLPLAEKEEDLRRVWEAEKPEYSGAKLAWDAGKDAAKSLTKNKGSAATLAALEELGPEPRQPVPPMLLVADPTPEALVLHLANGRPWAGVFTAEGGLLVGGAAFSDDARMRTGALLNALWDGEPIRRTRVQTGQTFLPGRRCAIHVMLQSVAADRLLGDKMLDGLGFLARTLISAPTSTAGTRMWREPDYVAKAAYGDYCQRFRYLLDLDPPMNGGGLMPGEIVLHPDAAAMWVAFHDRVEAQLADGGAYRGIRGFGAKMPEHAGRLAAVLAFYESGGEPVLPDVLTKHMASGIELAEHYAGEMLRLIGGAEVARDLRIAQAVLDWLKIRKESCFHLTEVYQRGPAEVRSAGAARAMVAILEDHGHVRKLKPGTVVDGTPRKEAWEVMM
jgi:hypothetical protein